MIKVLFFAQLREQLQCGEFIVTVNDIKTVTQLRDYLVQVNPGWAEFLKDENLLVAVNKSIVRLTENLQADDEVAFFPPVTGG